LITSIALNYSPEEVELYLIDFKKGVEFKTYASHRLPHARVIAIESEREFGLSVLEGLHQEYEQRGDHFRNAAVNGLKAYREATGQQMPRILLLVDEFHKFFIEQDKIATRAYQLLELLVREGRSAGIHVLLASQTLTGSASLPNSIKEQIGIRVALQCSEADSRLILSDDNPAARLLSRPGEAIYNEANGLVEGNNTFQVAWLTDEQREHYLNGIQNRAQADQTSQIVFEGNQPADIEKNNELQTALIAPAPTKSPRSLKAWVGEPTAIREPTAVTFQRESGNNLLMVGTDEQAAMGILVTSIISLAAQLPPTPAQGAQTFSVLDFSTTDTEEDNPFQYLAEKLPHPIAVGRRRQLPGMINVVANEVQRRLQDDDTSAPPIFLIIYGLQRARDLRLDVPGTGYGASTFTAEEAPSQEAQESGMSNEFGFEFGPAGSTPSPAAASNPSQQLPMILREGPDFGVYTLVWCDTMTNLNRTFERSALREFILRVAFQMSENDSYNFVESSAANKLGDHRALLYNDEKGTGEKFRPYAVPSQQWVEKAIKNLTG
jgi:DNA segregation ATPase FtsK/SpoIIIE-like protein